MRELLSADLGEQIKGFISQKHPGAICVANYKGGVGKTTLVCLLGYYLAEITRKKVLLFDIDPQCSLSLALGFDPDKVNKTELTIYNLVEPSRWSKIRSTDFKKYVFKAPDPLSPKGLHIVRGSFDVDELDMEIAKSVAKEGERRVNELFLYCKQMLAGFDEYDYILVDCPPNKMFLTQAMLRACSYYMPVTIPDAVSVYGMPRLLRWVKKIDAHDRPKLLGYVLNAINRTGGVPGGKVYSQQDSETRLLRDIRGSFQKVEEEILGNTPALGNVPRLDAIARFLGEGTKYSRFEFSRKTSGQDTIDECLRKITNTLLKRIDKYRAKT